MQCSATLRNALQRSAMLCNASQCSPCRTLYSLCCLCNASQRSAMLCIALHHYRRAATAPFIHFLLVMVQGSYRKTLHPKRLRRHRMYCKLQIRSVEASTPTPSMTCSPTWSTSSSPATPPSCLICREDFTQHALIHILPCNGWCHEDCLHLWNTVTNGCPCGQHEDPFD